jgi:formylglycine-generating enzyme required for sulfatase activity
MKSCPTCNRTFDDAMTFCLVDGSILSAPFELRPGDRQATPQTANSDRTERLPHAPKPTRSAPHDRESTPPATIASPGAQPPPTEAASTLELKPALPETAASHSVMKTMKAPLPEVIPSRNQREVFAAERDPAAQSAQTDSAGVNRYGLIAGGVILAIMLIGGSAWLIQRARTRAATPVTPQASSKRDTNIATPTGESFAEKINGAEIRLVSVPGGSFLMGSPPSEAGRDKDEGPQSEVTVKSFYMDSHEVTQAQYQAVMGSNPSSFKGDNLPVDGVTWIEANEFCRKLSQATGRAYRLPTEAEWEYAARAGSSGPFFGDLTAMSWYGANSGHRAHPVGQKQPNKFGLYDMNGNLWEWCQSKYQPYPYQAADGREDLQDGAVRVLRGGSWESSASSCRSAYRRRVVPDARTIGFRILLASS